MHFGTFRTDYAVEKACTFTGEGIGEVVGLTCCTGMDEVYMKEVYEATWVITLFYSLRGCTCLQGNVSCGGKGSSKCLSRD